MGGVLVRAGSPSQQMTPREGLVLLPSQPAVRQGLRWGLDLGGPRKFASPFLARSNGQNSGARWLQGSLGSAVELRVLGGEGKEFGGQQPVFATSRNH